MISGKIVKGAYEQAKLSMEHCLTILHEAGGSIETIGMTIVYVTDLSIKDQVNKVQNILNKLKTNGSSSELASLSLNKFL